MSYYKIFHKLINGDVAKYFVWDKNLQRMVESNIMVGQIEPIEEDDEIIDELELTDIIKSRFTPDINNSQLVFSQDNFLPIAALRTLIIKGLRCSSAICRLVRNYTTNESDIEEIIKFIVTSNLGYRYPKAEINSILGIKQNDDFWQEYDQINTEKIDPIALINALKNNSNFVSKLKSKAKDLPIGTGFLVGKKYLLTNHHILPDRESTKNFIAQFSYEQDALGNFLHQIEYKLDSSFFITDRKLDYSLVKVAALTDEERDNKYKLIFNDAGDNFGWLSMCAEKKLIAPPYNRNRTDKNPEKYVYQNHKKSDFYDFPGEPAIIIQHPKGRDKEIVIFNNRVQKIYKNFIQYETSTLPGSSGSPVLTQNWQLVALHHATLIDSENNYTVGNLGIKICKIVENLQKQAQQTTEFTQELNEFINRYVLLNNRLIPRGRIFLVANYVGDYTSQEPGNYVKQIRDKIINKLAQLEDEIKHGFQVFVVPDNLVTSEAAIKWIENSPEYNEYKVGDIALQIYVSERKPENERGTTIFYVANKDERRLHAELLLQSLTNKISELPSQGARSDSGIGKNGIDFCRNLKMPSLRMRLGFWHDPEDKKIIIEKREEIADVIAKGLLACGDTLSPIPVLPKFEVKI
ncbi:trypsin-like peptidase domain-containing protein [Calothrix sp. FACHB-1219]|uniref:trypsin-like peptidase domain-containing protein n=1 Tax=unclassified Calothrix TaxID=2619626 RepID=UPI00168868F6|nr:MULTISPECIES: trypsin-like peptidase domain-containing protein [unclassified Calothrix]MBD2200957.1 trypsin-like peptidase domain-containing protein [Calothrix sp. FACHB-168]MBD2219765.1 trypsin-like peptidase domain-containing protein [Calothrix sp. FACHB-1219]